MTWPFADRWDRALTYEQFVKESKEHCALWTGVHRAARIPDWASERVAELGERFRVVVLAEDWCGDATNTVPVLAKWAELTPNVELRILRRDEHPEVMQRYLTDGTRSIPVAIVLTEAMDEIGWWGPRPAELQEWVKEQRRAGRTKLDFYPEVRRWYAKDKGETTLRELFEVMSRVRV
ncbi:MAG: thioredoxin family protein [Gemmatimonadales bacterium]|nr:thioredoxin family protein [Gemmatimonadales bacterium]